MQSRNKLRWLTVPLLLAALSPARAADVEILLTADNAYGLGYGTAGEITHYFGIVENLTAGQIFSGPVGNGPEAYTLQDADPGGYLYILAWSDDSISQGVLGQLRVEGHPAYYTGQGDWEVFATGIDLDIPVGGGGPPVSAINGQIAIADAGTGSDSTSGLWVGTTGGALGNLAFGEDNSSPGGDFQLAALIDPAARWMWFNRSPGVLNAFRDGNHKEALLFRLPLAKVPGVTQEAFGLLHAGVGTASISIKEQGVQITDLSPDGTSGFQVLLEPSLRWGYVLDDAGFAQGKGIVHFVEGTIAGVPEQRLAALNITRTGSRTRLAPDLSRGGHKPRVRVILRNGSQVLLDSRNHLFPSIATGAFAEPLVDKAAGDPVPGIDVSLEQKPGGNFVFNGATPSGADGTGPFAANLSWELFTFTPVAITFDGKDYVGDRIVLIEEPAADLPAIDSASRVTLLSNAPSFSFSQENVIGGALLDNRPLLLSGDAVVRRTLESAVVSLQDADGVTAAVGDADALEIGLADIAGGRPASGARLGLSFRGTMEAGVAQELASAEVASVNGVWDTLVDFEPAGSSQQFVEVLLDGQLRQSATLSNASKVRHESAMNSVRNLKGSLIVEEEWSSPTAITLPGQAPVQGDLLRITASDLPSEVASITDVRITGEKLGSVTLTSLATPCVPGPTRLCLNGGRFLVESRWKTAQGEGAGHAVPLTGDTGFFWFFSGSNVEMVVKVLDACGLNGSFWVFAGGLTDVEVETTVTDTFTGAVQTYRNPQGAKFQPLQDTAAFPTCGAAPSSRASIRSAAVASTKLLLNNGRFEVEAVWETAQGQSDAGQAVSLTGDTGYFWFFDSANVEVVIKVLNGCGLNNRYWVFAGGLTNVRAVITVTDTLTGASKTYTNPQGTAFQPIQDTSALAACP
jgi:hypothetical protein